MGVSAADSEVRHKRSSRDPASWPYLGTAIISDGGAECEAAIEIHASFDKNDIVTAWHAIVKDRLAHGLRFPAGKPVTVVLPDGSKGTGILVDPQLIKGTGRPPC